MQEEEVVQPQISLFTNKIDLSGLENAVSAIETEIAKVVVGQDKTIKLMLTSLFCGGHILLEGVPGVAKTLTAKLLAQTLALNFKRIQFTPDLMPSDVLGTSVFNPKSLAFEFKKGPIFSQFVLIDEINRSPAKTQAALFEAMEERQITMDGERYMLDAPFIVIATQNPIEQEGTYRLPEGQLDRFLMKIKVGYPNSDQEINMLSRFNYQTQKSLNAEVKSVLSVEELLKQLAVIQSITVEENILQYIINVIQATRKHSQIELGCSPRSAVALLLASKAWAGIHGRDFVIPEDIKAIGNSVLAHRLIVSAEAEMEGIGTEQILSEIFDRIEIPR